MKEENRKYFVYYGNKTVLTGKLLAQGVLGIVILAAAVLFFGFMTNERTKTISVVLLCYAVVYAAAHLLLAVKIKQRLLSQCIAKGIGSVTMSMFFLIVSVMIVQAGDDADWITAIFIIGYFVFMGICIGISKFFIDRGAFRNRKDVRKRNIWMFSLGGGLLGISISRTLGSLLNQDAMRMVVAVGSYTAAVLCTVGVMHWMKYYFIRKYGFEDVELDAESN